jgi:hypothetical protein
MKIMIESTTKIVLAKTSALADGIECRVWEGFSEGGVAVQCLIPRIAALPGGDLAQFEKELSEQRPPSAEAQAFPLRMIL